MGAIIGLRRLLGMAPPPERFSSIDLSKLSDVELLNLGDEARKADMALPPQLRKVETGFDRVACACRGELSRRREDKTMVEVAKLLQKYGVELN